MAAIEVFKHDGILGQKSPRQRVAIIGTGISGLVCANLLTDTHDVVVYEKETEIGIGAQGFDVPVGDGKPAVRLDVPHRIVNMQYYAELVRFLQHRGLQFEKEVMQMSWADTELGSVLQYNSIKVFGRHLPSIPISQLASNPIRYLHLIYDALFFYPRARKDLESGKLASLTLGDYLDYLRTTHGFTSVFLGSVIVPILSLALTADYSAIRTMPADIPIRYISSGMFSLRRRDTGVYRPVGGVTRLSSVLAEPLKDIRVSTQITKITKLDTGKLELDDSNGGKETFDHIVIATPANHAFSLVGHLDPVYESLSQIKHTQTKVVLHTDSIVMGPADPKFNFHILSDRVAGQAMASIWLNPSNPQLPIDVHQTTNPIIPLDPSKILFQHVFERPLIDMAAAAAIRSIQTHNGANHIWFCGSYSLYGMPLLENGARSAFLVAEALSGRCSNIPVPSTPRPSLLGRLFRFALVGGLVIACTTAAILSITPGTDGMTRRQRLGLFASSATAFVLRRRSHGQKH